MENIIADRVKMTTLTKSQQKIAEYLIRNAEHVGALTSLDIAREIGVSDASVIRFARAIGFEGYADLKEQVYRRLVENAYGSLSLSERLFQNAEKYGGGSAGFMELMERNLESLFRNNSLESYEDIAGKLVQAEHRYVVGMRGCRGVAAQFGRLLSYILPQVHTLLHGDIDEINSLQDIGEKDILLMFVFSRFYKIDQSFAELAKRRGAAICLVTNTVTGPLAPMADTILRLNTDNMSFFHSTLAVDAAGEYILKLVGDRVDFHERIEETDRITETERI